MFTGIIETLGTIQEIKKENSNVHITMNSSITGELQIDQSVAHNGICLTVVAINDTFYTVTAIGHIVQGHVDQTGTCTTAEQTDGSWLYTFEYDEKLNNITIEKGSITVNGVSLTVVNSKKNEFSVAIIPYTYEHTNFKTFEVGTKINLEFDVIGKYVSRLYANK